MGWNDRTAKHNAAIIIYIVSLSFAGALVLTGMVGVLWGLKEAVKMIF